MNNAKLREHAAEYCEDAFELIKEILIRHNMATLKAVKEVVDTAVLSERDARVQLRDLSDDEIKEIRNTIGWSMEEQWHIKLVRACFEAARTKP